MCTVHKIENIGTVASDSTSKEQESTVVKKNLYFPLLFLHGKALCMLRLKILHERAKDEKQTCNIALRNSSCIKFKIKIFENSRYKIRLLSLQQTMTGRHKQKIPLISSMSVLLSLKRVLSSVESVVFLFSSLLVYLPNQPNVEKTKVFFFFIPFPAR